MFTLNPSGRALSRAAQAPAGQAAPAPAIEPVSRLLRARPDITFKLGDRPKGTPGKGQFTMRTVFNLNSAEYMSVLDGVRQLCIIGRLDMARTIKSQDGPRLRTVCNMVLETFPGFGEFDDPKWPIEAFIYVVLKGSAEKAKKLEKPPAAPAPALTEDEQAARRDLRREAQRKAALARHEARRAAALQGEAESDPETLDIDGIDEVDNVVGNISGLRLEQGEVPVEPPAGAARTRPTTRTPAHTPTEPEVQPVVAPANLPARPPASPTTGPIRSAAPVPARPVPHRRAATPLDPAPPAEPIHPNAPANSAPPAADPAPTPVANPVPAVANASDTASRTAGQPFGGSLGVSSRSSAVLSRVGSVFLDLGEGGDDSDELSEPSATDTESQAVTGGKGKAKAAAGKGAKGGGKASGDSGAAGKTGKGAKKGTKKAADKTSTNKPAPAATTRPRRGANKLT